ncbi:DgyrCDS12067 [Dimorphilus gyrociliatus]|uniref:DgyrCDS12067 n=1 Tax=Dimorphilus gyrociliatus TaxID=2664684 RepID=A0A7I8W771_9ANNE|nr:DgyrCDS12067 [Dimorphilus gyrociliatus]
MYDRKLKVVMGILLIVSYCLADLKEDNENETLEKTATDKSRGFNSNIKWLNDLDQAITMAKDSDKLIFLLLHKSWCRACKELKPSFSSDNELLELSKKFIMVNLEDDEEPRDDKYSPDGGYIPRAFFLQKNGEPILSLYNKEGNEKYKYYYSFSSQVVKSMNEALSSETNNKLNSEL